MSIQSEIARIEAAKNDIVAAVADKGVSVPEDVKLDGIAALIAGIATGGGNTITLPEGYAMEMGIYIPASDISSTIEVQLEKTFRWADTGKTSACYLAVFAVDLRKGTQAAGAALHVKFGVGERNHNMVTTTSGASTSSTVFINPSTTTTFKAIKLTGTSSYPMKTGISYLWAVIGELAS